MLLWLKLNQWVVMSKKLTDLELLKRNNKIGANYEHVETEFTKTLLKTAALQQKFKQIAKGKETLKPERLSQFKNDLTKLEKQLPVVAKKLIETSKQVSEVSTQVKERSLISRDEMEEAVHQMDLVYGNVKAAASDIDDKKMRNVVADAMCTISGNQALDLIHTKKKRC